jgi:hypothetical protein
MHLANSLIEDMSFVPRLVPLSLSHPVTKIACGSAFALVITKVRRLCEETILFLFLHRVASSLCCRAECCTRGELGSAGSSARGSARAGRCPRRLC